jgi:hypothetical protein
VGEEILSPFTSGKLVNIGGLVDPRAMRACAFVFGSMVGWKSLSCSPVAVAADL